MAEGKHPGGRPLLFKTVGELQQKIDAYFADCDPHPERQIRYEWHQKIVQNDKGENVEVNDYSQPPIEVVEWGISHQKPYLITGLANFLETSRRTLINYEEKDGEFFHTIKKAKDRCEQYQEQQLNGPHATGPIFNLKNNYDWQDQQELKHSGQIDRNLSEQELDAILSRARSTTDQASSNTQA